MRKVKRNYFGKFHSHLRRLNSKNPKEYWNIINKASNSLGSCNSISLQTFRNHFKELNETKPLSEEASRFIPDYFSSENIELNECIAVDEVNFK